jgi:hypothetical protein
VKQVLDPQWALASAQPPEVPSLFQITLNRGRSRDALAPAGAPDPEDDLWSIQSSAVASMTVPDNIFVASPPSEDPPPLVFHRALPNGTYAVEAFIAILPDEPVRASSVSYSVPGRGGASGVARLAPPPEGGETYGYVPLGDFEVSDDLFRLKIGVGDQNDNAVIGHLLFRRTDVAAGSDSPEAIRTREERLRALGYVD